MSEYKVTSLMKDEPKEWKGPHGSVWYHSVMVDGHDKPLSVGKKEPNSIKVGDIIYGDITETDYLEDKFKPSPPPQGGSKATLEYEPSTNARWAIGMAYRAFISATGSPEDATGEFPFDAVKQHAGQLLIMFDELKSGDDLTKVEKTFGKTTKADPLPLPPEDLDNAS